MLIYPETRTLGNLVVIDGYSNRKTLVGAINEMGRFIAKNIDAAEGRMILDYGVASLQPAKYSYGGYFFEIEEVPCASRIVDEETDEIEYTDANYYLVCRIVKD